MDKFHLDRRQSEPRHIWQISRHIAKPVRMHRLVCYLQLTEGCGRVLEGKEQATLVCSQPCESSHFQAANFIS